MLIAPFPSNEQARLRKLRDYNILDTLPETSYDRITRFLATILNVPITVVSLVDQNRQWFKSKVGLDAEETHRDLAFCAHAILTEELLVVPDARCDPRFSGNPLVVDAPAIRFYAGAPLTTPDGYNLGTLCAIDLKPRELTPTERTHLQDLAALVVDEIELSHARSRAERAERVKSEFLATMSHEIRTPMTGVMGFADILLEQDLPAPSKSMVKKIKESTRILLRIINGILDISKLEAGKMEVENLDFHMPALLGDVISLFEGSGRAPLEFSLVLTDDFPEAVNTDPTRVRQILINLVGNAVKFTKAGRISVEGGLTRTANGEPAMRIAVRDTGIGIADDAVDKLFVDFSQADFSISRRFEGSGLGLAICKRLVELLGGEIGVESELGKGSTFWFTLPHIAATSQVSPLTETSSVPEKELLTLRTLKILVAEDNEINQMIIAKLLEAFGHDFEMVENGAAAVKAHETREFDLILMDVRMPEVSGPEATRIIRRMAGNKGQIPIVALTADAMTENRVGYFDAGMNEVATKPIDRAELAAAINRAMGAEIHMITPTEGARDDDRAQSPQQDDPAADAAVAAFLAVNDLNGETEKP